ncbi:MAG: NAAT family transporter [Blastocatellia bacterium]|nr:NAAT family transporter [Blastocatellia bacterium]MBL8196495.1 NAAT family transporter [Blastocatellia bacterium]MBN8722629.1 NAAT family transporter [Acidobacteriota bacterium]
MSDVLSFGLLSFTSLLTIIDPIAAAPVFVTMTEKYDNIARRQTAFRACISALVILLVFAIGGGVIFKIFGITVDALRIAGGILFFMMAMQMLLGKERSTNNNESLNLDQAIVPLGIPLICGPGAISTVMVLMGQNRSISHVAVLILAIILVIVLTALVLLVSPNIVKLIGKSGVAVITRVIGLIVCTIGIQFIIDGLKPVIVNILSSVK